MKNPTYNKKKILFVVGIFPAVSETFIINQVADLFDRGFEVDIFAFNKGDESKVSKRYFEYRMNEKVSYINPPNNFFKKILSSLFFFLYQLFFSPNTLFRCMNVRKYGAFTTSFKTLFWIRPFLGKEYDVIHCHFGTIANKYLIIRSILNQKTKFVTTLYGYDVSHIPKEKGESYYHELSQECSKFLVMSENMKSRVLPLGIPEEKIEVHPISIDVDSYPFYERSVSSGEKFIMTSVGRFVEKKGFDDLLKAIEIVKEKSDKDFVCNIVGDGELKDELLDLAQELDINDVIDFKGYMKMEDILKLYEDSHLYLQASKTASDGDME